MPLVGAIVLLIQFSFAFHVVKTGRPYWWLFVIMAFPVLGCVLYYLVEVFPASREHRSAERAVRAVVKALDPEKALRERVADLEACGSVANRMALARECVERGMHAEAATLYRSCLAGPHENDPDIRSALAGALALAGGSAEALELADGLRRSHPAHRPGEIGLVRASALEGLGRLEDALAELAALAEGHPGEEARWRYGALLKRLGRAEAARAVFDGMLRNAERQPPHYREAQKHWLGLARQNLQA